MNDTALSNFTLYQAFCELKNNFCFVLTSLAYRKYAAFLALMLAVELSLKKFINCA